MKKNNCNLPFKNVNYSAENSSYLDKTPAFLHKQRICECWISSGIFIITHKHILLDSVTSLGSNLYHWHFRIWRSLYFSVIFLSYRRTPIRNVLNLNETKTIVKLTRNTHRHFKCPCFMQMIFVYIFHHFSFRKWSKLFQLRISKSWICVLKSICYGNYHRIWLEQKLNRILREV